MILEIKGLSKTINNKMILNNISFSAETNEIVGFIGNNGAGKTTTIKCIFQEYKYTQGKILVDGHPINNVDLNHIAFFPDQNNFPKNYRIAEYCKYNYKLSGFKGSKKFNQEFDILLDALDLTQQKNAKFKELSSGMQKRALLLSILITKPKMIILDEPTSNLDVSSRQDFIALLKMLAIEKGIVILITSHNIDELDTFVNKVVIIDDGKILWEQKFDNTVLNLSTVYNYALNNTQEIISKIDNSKIKRLWENE